MVKVWILSKMKKMRNNLLENISYNKYTNYHLFEIPWKFAIILDACRYDVFKRLYREYGLKGKLEYRITKATHTTHFLKQTFTEKYYRDIVYVTANPQVSVYCKDKFFKLIEVWDDGWDDYYNTVLPKTMYEYCLEAVEKYPDKRFIFHFLQPHHPYLNCPEETMSRVMCGKAIKTTDYFTKIYDADLFINPEIHNLYNYEYNLRAVLPYVKRLTKYLHGTIVITADHGEAFGEKIHPLLPFRVYGHPYKIKLMIPALTKVPWMVMENDD